MPSDPASRTLSITADLVANVIAVHVAIGDAVRAGQVLLLVESMKMEIPVTAPEDGTVTAIGVGVGDIVQEGDLLVGIER